MIGGYASAARWNAHYIEMEKRAGERARAMLDERAAEIREAFPKGASWDDWYTWAKANMLVELNNLYHYGAGHADEAHNVFRHFVGITGPRAQ